MYNSEKWIARALHSMLNQTYRELQIIVVDDGSTDSSREVVAGIKDSRIQLFENLHKGISAVVNYGIRQAESKFIARLDSDDFSIKERLEIQYNYMKKHPDFGVISSDFIVIDENEKQLLKVRYPVQDRQIRAQLPRKCCMIQSSLFFNKELIQAAGMYNENLTIAEDWDILLKLMDKTKFYNIPGYLTYIRKHSRNITNKDRVCKIQEEIVPVSYFHAELKKSLTNQQKANVYFNLGYFFYYRNEFKRSKMLIANAVKLNSLNPQYLRYYIFCRMTGILSFFRRTKLYRIFDLLRLLDRNNVVFRNKY